MPKPHKVFVSDKLHEAGLEILKHSEGIEVTVQTGLPPDELAEQISGHEGLIVRSGTKVTRPIIERADSLRVIGRAGTGVDNVDVVAATERGIVVMNTPLGNAVTTAEHAIALMLALFRNIPQADRSLREGRWDRKKYTGQEVANKVLGVIGVGNIGSIVAERAIGLKMKVMGYDPYIPEEVALKRGVHLVPLDTLLAEADVLTVHIPLNDDTRHLIDEEAFKKMKPGVRLINAARGGIVSEKALYDAISSGHVAGAALDVYEQEPPKDSPLLELDQVVATPHLGASTDEAQVNVAVAIASQIVAFLGQGLVSNAVNMPSISPEILEEIRPYLDLSEKLGLMLGHLLDAPVERLDVEFAGEIAELNIAPLLVAAQKGMLVPAVGENVNYVNAPMIARNRGIQVVESRSDRTDQFASAIALRASSKSFSRIVVGAVFGGYQPRVVRIDDFYIEMVLEGHMLVLHNQDRRGVVGNIGTLLGDNGINISRMQLGLLRESGEAMMLVNVDEQVGEAVLGKITKLPHVISAKQIRF